MNPVLIANRKHTQQLQTRGSCIKSELSVSDNIDAPFMWEAQIQPFYKRPDHVNSLYLLLGIMVSNFILYNVPPHLP